jgi:hypothetical protein
MNTNAYVVLDLVALIVKTILMNVPTILALMAVHATIWKTGFIASVGPDFTESIAPEKSMNVSRPRV